MNDTLPLIFVHRETTVIESVKPATPLHVRTFARWTCPGGTEGDRQLFDRILVTAEQLPEVPATPIRSPGLLVANKSEGKTATC
jgi:hypothetical protein